MWIYLQPHGHWVARRIPVDPDRFQPGPTAGVDAEPVWEKVADAAIGMVLDGLGGLGTM
jgi:hypothetical protein